MADHCEKDAVYRYTWPGRDESFICSHHAEWLRSVASAMGFSLQLIPVNAGTAGCAQKVTPHA